MLETNRIIQGDCVVEMGKLPESTVDLVVTSPPYNVGIDYDSHDDRMTMEDYWEFTEQWLSKAFRLLKDDGRIAVNIPYEVNVQDRGGRILFMSEFWNVMKKVGFQFYGLVTLTRTHHTEVKLRRGVHGCHQVVLTYTTLKSVSSWLTRRTELRRLRENHNGLENQLK